MCMFKKSLIDCFLIVLLFLLVSTLSADKSENKVSAAVGNVFPYSAPDAQGFYNEVKGFPNWDGNFYLKSAECKKIYYEKAPGQENEWIDTSDIHYHISHGIPALDDGKTVTGILFRGGDILVPSEAKDAWGDNNLEWIGFRNCSLFNDNSWKEWAKTMNKLHLLLGFKTSSHKHDDFGKIWAENMQKKKFPKHRPHKTKKSNTITQAWFKATDLTQPSYVVARVIAEKKKYFKDHLWCNGRTYRDSRPDDKKYYKDHQAGTPPYLDVNNIPGGMYIYDVNVRELNEEYIRNIGQAFGMSNDEVILDTENSYLMTREDDTSDPNSGFILEVFKASGQFYFTDLSKLWIDVDANGFCPDPYTVANNFLVDHNLKLPDVGANDIEYEYIYESEPNVPDVCYPLLCSVVFARELDGGPSTPVSVAGPGARLKVYLAQDGNVIGAMGNWRDVQITTEIPNKVPIMSEEDAWQYYQDYREKVTVAPIYVVDYNHVNYETATLAYYEYSGVDIQGKLIPVWIFDANYCDINNVSVAEAEVYIPVDTTFFPPVVKSIAADVNDVNEGVTVNFSCTLDPNFNPGDEYTFNWWSDVDGELSNVQNFGTNSLTVGCLVYGCDCIVEPHIITLTVTNETTGLQCTETVSVKVNGACPNCPDCSDLNRDGTIDFHDLAIFTSSWLAESNEEPNLI